MKRLHFIMTCSIALVFLVAWSTNAVANPDRFNSCAGCHADDSVSCAACHAHGVHANSSKNTINLTATTDKSVYAPAETVEVSITGGYRGGWVRAILYDASGNEVSRSSGACDSPLEADLGCGSGEAFPVMLTAPAPAAEGSYTFFASWYGNLYDEGSAAFGPNWQPDPFNPGHGEEIVETNLFDVIAPLECTDDDGDGFAAEGADCGPADCDDTDATINPDAAEFCNDGIDNDCDSLVDADDPDCLESDVDYDIVRFRCTPRARVGRDTVRIMVAVRNQDNTDPGAILRMYGIQNATIIPLTSEEGLKVFDGPELGAKRLQFSYTPEKTGKIEWHAELADGNPDRDEAFCTTTVRDTAQRKGDDDDHISEDGDDDNSENSDDDASGDGDEE